jgi:hypothetical protein
MNSYNYHHKENKGWIENFFRKISLTSGKSSDRSIIYILWAFGFGLLIWIIDALLDFLIFYPDYGTFPQILITNPPGHEIYIRLVILAGFIVFGVFIGRQFVKRKQIEKELRHEEAKLLATFKGIGDAVISTDKQGYIKRMNPVAEQITGWSEAEGSGKLLDNILRFIREDNEVMENPVNEVIHKDSVIRWADHKVILLDNGREIPVAASGSPIRDESNRAGGVVLVFRDQTVERLSTQMMKARLSLVEYASNHSIKDFLRRMLEIVEYFTSSRMSFYLFIDSDRQRISFQQWSSQTVDLFHGYENIERYEDIDQAKTWADCLKERGPVIGNYYKSAHNIKEDQEWPVWITNELLVPVIREGNVVAVLAMANKPTEYSQNDVDNVSYFAEISWEVVQHKQALDALQESERKLQTLMGNLQGMVYRCRNTITWPMEFVSHGAFELTGYKPEEIMQGKPVDYGEIIHPEDREFVWRSVQESVSKNSHFQVEYRIIDKYGALKWVWERGIVVEKGESAMLEGFIMDVTQRRNAEEQLKEKNEALEESLGEIRDINAELKKAKEKAEESDRLKSAFLANMSHEIRTPMNGIMGFAHLLKKARLSGEKRQQYIEMIEQSGNRMLNIINDLIDISKIEAGQVEVHPSEFNVNEQLRYLYTFFLPEAETKGLKLTVTKPLPDDKAFVYNDKDKFYLIFSNLIKNALKYTHEGSIHFGYLQKGKELEFYVEDTGVGIPGDKQKAIFDRFFRADMPTGNFYEGAGLGLSITKAYVEMLGGEIDLQSEEGEGTRFLFTLAYEGKPSEESSAQYPTRENLQANKLKDMTLLIVEDDSTADLFITEMLNDKCNKIVHAKNGKEAVDLLRERDDIDLILMDIKMPEMDGYTATKKIREFNNDVVIIAQTAYALSGDREKAISAGCDDYLTKPIDEEEFFRVLSNNLPEKN